MKKVYVIILFCLVVLVPASCVKSEVEVDEKVNLEDISVIVPKDSYMSDRKIIKFHSDLGEYKAIFNEVDARIAIAFFRCEQTGQENTVAFYDSKEESLLEMDFASRVKLNGKDVFSSATKFGDNSLAELFGEVVKFDLSGLGFATKGSSAGNVEMYVPAPLQITFPQYDNGNHLPPLCYDQDFIVRWNADTQNKNGVMAIVKWDGTVLFGEDYPSSYVVHFKKFPDTGSAKLDGAMFEGIPDTAYCSLFLLRGDMTDIDVDQIDYQLLAEAHDALDFALVKNVIKKKK